MESMNWTAEQAMAALKIPEADRGKYITKLQNECIWDWQYMQAILVDILPFFFVIQAIPHIQANPQKRN